MVVHRMRPIILFRPPDMDATEEEAASTFFPTFRERTRIQKDDLVIGRYSVLPFFADLQADVDYVGATLINNYRQHRFAADMRNWCELLEGQTPQTWYQLEDIPADAHGPFVLKGQTNSRKFDWRTHMYASDIQAARDVYWRLCTDGLIGHDSQNIYIRQYEPLRTFMEGLNGLPVTNEFRIFVAYGQILTGAYYWSNYVDDLPEVPQFSQVPTDFVQSVIDKIGNRINFYALDVAQKVDGSWMVVEINDGQMSGLSENNPTVLYANLASVVWEHETDRHPV